MKIARRSAVILGGLALVVLAGCAGGDRPKPTPLVELTPKIAGRQVWSAKVDGVQFPLGISVRAGRAHVAGNDGTVLALDAQTGATVWQANVGARLSAGVGSDGRFAAVVTRDNEVVVLEGGNVLWRASVPAQVATPPLVAGERVFVVGVDRVVHAFDVLDGRRLWVLKRPGDSLTLSQAGVLTAYKDTLLVGQGVRLLGVDPVKGTVRWEVPITTPRGTNEVERLADLVGPAAREGSSYCVRAFQAAVGCVDAERGTLRWNQNGGGIAAVAGDADFIFGADGSDRITARQRAGGEVAWTSEALLHRGLSAPTAMGKTVVFGDSEGWMHFLARDSGELLLRLPTDGSQVVSAPVLWDNTLIAATRNGGIFAFRPE
ncbi:MAG: outer membrane protein assembly factor BamB [Ideonella sp. MAG2]|nr:MAG: outer membrane protein assembly factor BamB [Ideonella sp. MAG2]